MFVVVPGTDAGEYQDAGEAGNREAIAVEAPNNEAGPGPVSVPGGSPDGEAAPARASVPDRPPADDAGGPAHAWAPGRLPAAVETEQDAESYSHGCGSVSF